MDFLFIAGCPRSGTTALLDLLNADPRMALGMERFKRVVPEPASFEPAHFLAPTPDETNIKAQAHYRMLAERLESGRVRIMGDKTPGHYKKLPALHKNFPNARYILLFRDIERVASSFEQRSRKPTPGWPESKDFREGIEQWNLALRLWQRFEHSGTADRVFPLCYEWFFCGDLRYLGALYGFLGLSLEPEMVNAYFETATAWNRLRKKPLVLDDAQRRHAAESADRELESWARRRAAGVVAAASTEYPQPFRDKLGRFAPFVLAARDEQLALLADGAVASPAGDEALHRLVQREAAALARRSTALREQLEQREASAWWRLGRLLHGLVGGGAGDGLVSVTHRVERSAHRLAGRVGDREQ